MPSFSERHGYGQPKRIEFRDELPAKLRLPIFEILRKSVPSAALWERIEQLFNPYGIDDWPKTTEPIPVYRGEDDKTVGARRVLLNCPWFRLYDLLEDIFKALYYHETELSDDPADRGITFRFRRDINKYFVHAGIGWKFDEDGMIVTRGDDAFEGTIRTAVAVLEEDAKPTAARRLELAIAALSVRPKPDTSGAVAHATSAVECVLGEITGASMTLGQYLSRNPGLFHPALKKGLEGIYGYASDEGARHGKEGVEPALDEAEFAVATCAATCALLTNKARKKTT